LAYIVLYFIVTYTMGMPQLKNTTDIWCPCNEATIQVLVCKKDSHYCHTECTEKHDTAADE